MKEFHVFLIFFIILIAIFMKMTGVFDVMQMIWYFATHGEQ